ncbi:MAG: transposase [candidate division WOR-3 bacterium]
MPGRKIPLVENRIYHIVSRSIEKYRIFRNRKDYERMRELLKYYQVKKPPFKYSLYLEIKDKEKIGRENFLENEKLVEIISYCLMPTHIHLLLKQVAENGISIYMGRILNSYAKYFNTKYKRKGPLWESRFKSIEVETKEELYHLTRYIHLNPVTAYLVENPEDWNFSSYKEFINEKGVNEKICNFEEFLEINKDEYTDFVISRKDYQRELDKIKRLLLE